MNRLIKRNLKVNIINDTLKLKNISNIILENCIIEVKNILYGVVLYEKFNIESDKEIEFNLIKDNFISEWIDEKLEVTIHSNHRCIYKKTHNDKSMCFVLISNDKFEKITEQLIIGLDKYTDIDILHYSIGYKSNLNYTNLSNIEFKIDEDTNDAHYMQFSKAPVFLNVLSLGYKNAIFLDADIQVRSTINHITTYISKIEDGPIFQKGAHDYTIVKDEYIPGPLVQEFLKLPKQKYPHGITNVVIFNEKHKYLFEEWNKICFSNEIKKIKEKEFLHDELLLNCLMWKLNIKPKYFYFGLNITNLNDVKFFYNYPNILGEAKVNMNDYDKGHPFQSFIPYDKSEILFFHCIKEANDAKLINEHIERKEINVSFRNDILDFYKDLKINIKRHKKLKPVININFITGGFLEITSKEPSSYLVTFIDKKSNVITHQQQINNNMWIKTNPQYYIDYKITIESNNEIIYEYDLNLKDKNVYISLESSSLGDSLAWIPYIDEFRKKHNCIIYVSTFINDIFINNYPNLNFIDPGTLVNNIFAMYKIGWFYNDDNSFNFNKNPIEFKNQPLQKTSSDMLGLEYKEMIPKLTLPKITKKKKVGIAIHGTSQAKYWNNSDGWQEVVDYLNMLGYEVMLYSKENDGYMNNKHPNNITKFIGGDVQDVINDLVTCEFFIGIGSGLSWLAWACKLPVILISGFSEKYTETVENTYRIINKIGCNGCFNSHRLEVHDWNWCPVNKNTDKIFECSKNITSKMVIDEIDKIIKK